MLPPYQGVYKRSDTQGKSVLPQEKRSSLRNRHQERSNTLIGRIPAGENPQYQRAPLSTRPQPFSCIGHHFPPESSLALFFITNSSGELFHITVLLGILAAHVANDFSSISNKIIQLEASTLI